MTMKFDPFNVLAYVLHTKKKIVYDLWDRHDEHHHGHHHHGPGHGHHDDKDRDDDKIPNMCMDTY